MKSKSHGHKEKDIVVVKEYEFIRRDKSKIDYKINICGRDCYDKYFHTFKLRCVFELK